MLQEQERKMTPSQLAEVQADIDFAKARSASFFRGIRAALSLRDNLKLEIEKIAPTK